MTHGVNGLYATGVDRALRYYWVRAHVTGIELEEEDGRNVRYGFFQNFWIWAANADGARRQVVTILGKDAAIQAQRSCVVVRYDIDKVEEREPLPDETREPSLSGRAFYPSRWYHRLVDRFRGEVLMVPRSDGSSAGEDDLEHRGTEEEVRDSDANRTDALGERG